MDWARGLSLQNINSLVHPFYPVGYYFLLRLGLEWNIDMARYGQFWSYLGSLLALISVFTIAQWITKRPFQAAATTILLALHPMFLYQAMREGTDMLATGLILLSSTLLFHLNESKRTSLLILLSGFTLGLAYLVRYTSLLFLPIHLVFLWRVHNDLKIRPKLILLLTLYLFAFFVTTLPQTAPSLLVKHTPFYNEQARNIWFGLYGDFNWAENWRKIPQDISLIQIIQDDPQVFLQHTFSEFSRIFLYEDGTNLGRLALERNVTLWTPIPIHLFWLTSIFILLLDKRIRLVQKGLLLSSLFIPVLITSMAWLFFRFLLVTLTIQALLMGTAISWLGNKFFPKHATAFQVVSIMAILLLFLPTTHWHIKPKIRADMALRNALITPLLQASGIQSPTMLLSNNRLYQISSEPSHPRYGLLKPFDENTPMDLPMFLKTIAPDKAASFLLFDWSEHAIRNIDYRMYQEDMLNAGELLLPLQIADDYSLYCQMPCKSIVRKPLPLSPNDILKTLEYAAFSSSDYSTQGFYLFGKATKPIFEDVTIQITLHDATDNLVQYTLPSSKWFYNYTEGTNFQLLAIPDFHPSKNYVLTIELITSDGKLILVSLSDVNFMVVK